MLLHSMRRVLSPLVVLLGLTVAIPSPSATTDGESLTGDALDRYCTAQLSSFEATYQSTQIATSRWTWYEGFGPTDSRGILTGSVTSQTYWTSTFYCKYCESRLHCLLLSAPYCVQIILLLRCDVPIFVLPALPIASRLRSFLALLFFFLLCVLIFKDSVDAHN